MPGPTSKPYPGPGADTPFVPTWCYPDGKPPVCSCEHHEGWHDEKGRCIKHGCACVRFSAGGESVKP